LRARQRGGLSYADLIAIAGDFNVSTQALLWRMLNLRLLPREQVHALLDDPELHRQDVAMRRGQWWWSPPPLPERYVRLSFLAWQQGHLARARLAEYLETDLAELDDFLASYGLREPEPSAEEAVDLSLTADLSCLPLEADEWPVTVPNVGCRMRTSSFTTLAFALAPGATSPSPGSVSPGKRWRRHRAERRERIRQVGGVPFSSEALHWPVAQQETSWRIPLQNI